MRSTPNASRHNVGRRLLANNRFNLLLGVAVALTNLLGYAAVVALSISFGPATFGAVGALSSLGVIAAIPAGTMQVLVSSRASRGEASRSAYVLGATVGAAQWIILVAASPILVDIFGLDSIWPLFWTGLTLIPMTMIGAQQGLLLGSDRLGRLSFLFIFSGVTRLGAALWSIKVDPTVSGAFFAWTIAAFLGLLFGHYLCRGLLPLGVTFSGVAALSSALAKSSLALLALFVFTGVDTIFARHFLSAHDSGIYSVASLFAKMIFWGTQFIAMIVVPRLAKRSDHFLVLKAYAAVALIALPVLIAVAVNPSFWLSTVGLDDYAEAGGLLLGFSMLGLFWSLTQVSIFADMGVGRTQMTRILWAGLAVQCLLTFTWLHSTPTQVWLATFIAAVFVTVTALGMMALSHHKSSRAMVESSS